MADRYIAELTEKYEDIDNAEVYEFDYTNEADARHYVTSEMEREDSEWVYGRVLLQTDYGTVNEDETIVWIYS